MKKALISMLTAAVTLTAFAPLAAQARPHQVCHFDRFHHHRTCHWVR